MPRVPSLSSRKIVRASARRSPRGVEMRGAVALPRVVWMYWEGLEGEPLSPLAALCVEGWRRLNRDPEQFESEKRACVHSHFVNVIERCDRPACML